jgi:hypothetical protein
MTVTTYGPTQLSLLERLAGADAVVVIRTATLERSEVDKLSENQREIGVFELTVRDVLDGDISETIRVRVARDSDGPWPFPAEGEFLALLQHDEPAGGWVLVHDSAFRLRGSSFDFDEAVGFEKRVEPRDKVSITELRRLIDGRRESGASYEAALRDREGKLLAADRAQRPSEMPESSELASWLDTEHGEGGHPGEPLRATADETRPRKRRLRRGDSTK